MQNATRPFQLDDECSALHSSTVRLDDPGACGRRFLVLDHHPIRIADVFLKLGEGFSLAENTRYSFEPSNEPLAILPILK